MKMNIEFNSNEEILAFIRTFGGAQLTNITPQVTSSESMVGITTEVKETKPTTSTIKETKPVVDKVVPTVEAEVVKVETPTIDPVQEPPAEKVITKEEVRAVFSKLIKAGKQAEAKKITLEFGANKLTELKEEHYAAAIEKVEALL